MGIKIKYRTPQKSEFTPSDIIIDVKNGCLFYKSLTNLYKVQGDLVEGNITTSGNSSDPITLKNAPGIPIDSSTVQIGKTDDPLRGTLTIQTKNSKVEIGSVNQHFCHFYDESSPEGFYFNKQISVNSGIFNSYSADLQLQCHRDNTKTRVLLKNDVADPLVEVYGDLIAKAHGTNALGQLQAENDVVAFASDKRLKENIIEIPNPIEKIKQLRGVYYDWKKNVKEKGFNPNRKINEIGMVAQEVEKVIPQAIEPAPFNNDYKTIKYDRIIPLLIECIKDQQNQIDKLKSLI